jgi:D-alanine-D-alanine ligase
MKNLHIEIVRSGTPALSSLGEKSATMIQALLQSHYAHVGITLVSSVDDLALLVAKRPDLVILGVKHIPTPLGELWVSGYLEAHDINYTGSQAAGIALDYDKPHAKRVIAAAGLATARSCSARPGQYTAATLPLSYPLFIKPPKTGGGKGIGADSVVRDWAGYELKVQQISDQFHTESLVESYLPGREFSVALLGQTDSPTIVAMPIELIAGANASGDRILSEAVKAADSERVMAVDDVVLNGQLSKFAKAAFRALGGRDYGRIDIRLDEQGAPQFLEANLIPGIAKNDFTSYFVAACELNKAMSYDTIILDLVALSLNRYVVPDELEPEAVNLAPILI